MGDPVIRARLTPYELVFTEGDFESRVFPEIRQELTVPPDAVSRDAFDLARAAGEVIRDVTPEDAPPEALEQYRAILYHAFHFWAEGRRLYAVEPAVARYLVEAPPALAEWAFASPVRAFYLQLPANLFWSSISPESPPEPVDGFFVTLTTRRDRLGGSYDHADLLAVLGIRRDRAGFSVIPLESEIGRGIDNPWMAIDRPGGDFATTLPGGELAGLYSIVTSAEVLKLVARVLWYLDAFPEGALDVAAAEAADRTVEPPPTHLAYVRLTLGAAAGGRP